MRNPAPTFALITPGVPNWQHREISGETRHLAYQPVVKVRSLLQSEAQAEERQRTCATDCYGRRKIGISALFPHATAYGNPVVDGTTYQIPFGGRNTAISVLPSPS